MNKPINTSIELTSTAINNNPQKFHSPKALAKTPKNHPKESTSPWVYSEIVKDYFLSPRNFLMGDESKFQADAVGLVGNPICGDQMKMLIKVNKSTERITDIKWKTYGCASAIAATSALSELAKGKTLDEALKIDAKMIEEYLGGLPKHKFHCSVLGHEALHNAIKNYRTTRTK